MASALTETETVLKSANPLTKPRRFVIAYSLFVDIQLAGPPTGCSADGLQRRGDKDAGGRELFEDL